MSDHRGPHRAGERRYRGGVRDAIYVIGGLAVVVFFIVRQRRSDRFRERSLLFPIALGIYGIVLLTSTEEHIAVSVASSVLLVLSAAASLGFGVIRDGRSNSSSGAASCGSAPPGRRSESAGAGSFSPVSR